MDGDETGGFFCFLDIASRLSGVDGMTIYTKASSTIQLAGKLGGIDLLRDYHVDEKDLRNVSESIALAVAAGYEPPRSHSRRARVRRSWFMMRRGSADSEPGSPSSAPRRQRMRPQRQSERKRPPLDHRPLRSADARLRRERCVTTTDSRHYPSITAPGVSR